MKKLFTILFLLLLSGGVFFFYQMKSSESYDLSNSPEIKSMKELEADGWSYLPEAGSSDESQNKDWWLNSGAYIYLKDNLIQSVQGRLAQNFHWRKIYASSNPIDTDDGYYPQNIMRLITQKTWLNTKQEAYFYISHYNLSESNERNESNGILLFDRYQDEDNLYYAGLRVDGDVVIKKKYQGRYVILAEKKYFSNDKPYDRENNQIILPINQWIGLKTEIKNIDNQSLEIKLFVDQFGQGDWVEVLSFLEKEDSSPFLESGHSGIRTDFMDVFIANYKIESLD